MAEQYDPQAVEAKWQRRWEAEGAYQVDNDDPRPPYYVLCMYPYPSGAAHQGHVRNYTFGDLLVRQRTMQGFAVLSPIGFDSFGLPAENAAIKTGVHPRPFTDARIEELKSSLKRLGASYDWRREIRSHDPMYMRWNQVIFQRFLDAGLAYRRNAPVNWCPGCQTVLANEQVLADGTCERSGDLVVKRDLEQWFFRITAYADELLEALEDLEWPERVKVMQRNWIGRSEGAEFVLPVQGHDGEGLRVFTTRPDTAFGMTFAVLAPEHPLVPVITSAEQRAEVEAFVERVRNESDIDRQSSEGPLDKRGVFTGAYAINPFNSKPVPIYLADYVLMTYGTGAIMAVPAEDQRDYDFATAYGLPIVRTVAPPEGWGGEAYTGEGPRINSAWLDGITDTAEAKARAIEWLEDQGLGRRTVNYRLRDWLLSRQRYWGCPIPVVHCPTDGIVKVPEDQLPVLLPDDVEFRPTGESPLRYHDAFLHTTCPKCGGPAERETDTMDTFVDSSWYFLRFCDPWDTGSPIDQEAARRWMSVDQYIGGIEHAILHLLYSRFWTKVMRDLGLVHCDEPFTNLLTQGMVLNHIYSNVADDGRRRYYNPADVRARHAVDGTEIFEATGPDGQVVRVEYGGLGKMSKSENNGVDPEGLVARFGADTARLFTMFAAPPEQTLEWSDEGVQGASRFLRRVWSAVYEHLSAGVPPPLDAASLSSAQRALRRATHQGLAKATDDIGRRRNFNTAIAACMELLNAVTRFEDATPGGRAVRHEALEIITLVLAPIVPHLSHALWQALGHERAVVDEPWPELDAAALLQDTVELVVQVNGKLRGRIQVSAGADEALVREAALADEQVNRFVAGQAIRKVIVVPGKLINIVV